MHATDESVDDFLAADDPDGTLAAIDEVLVANLPGAARRLWRGVFWGGTEQAIIGYGDIEQPRPTGDPVQWFLIGLARQKRHVSLYVNAVDEGAYLSQTYGPRLGRTKVGSASVAFRSVGDLDLGVLAELTRHAARVADWS